MPQVMSSHIWESMGQRRWQITSSYLTNQSSHHSCPSMDSMNAEVWRPRWLSVPWLMPVEQVFMRVLPLGWSNPLPCLVMITWSNYQFRPRVTHKERYSVSTTASPTTLRSKEPSTVFLLVLPMGMITKESWLLGYNWLAPNLRVPRLERSSLLGLSRCLPDVSPELN